MNEEESYRLIVGEYVLISALQKSGAAGYRIGHSMGWID